MSGIKHNMLPLFHLPSGRTELDVIWFAPATACHACNFIMGLKDSFKHKLFLLVKLSSSTRMGIAISSLCCDFHGPWKLISPPFGLARCKNMIFRFGLLNDFPLRLRMQYHDKIEHQQKTKRMERGKSWSSTGLLTVDRIFISIHLSIKIQICFCMSLRRRWLSTRSWVEIWCHVEHVKSVW